MSLELATRFNGEIVNCDSVAMYREFEIGTAKPSPGDRARVTHHLLDCLDPTSHYTAGDYSRDARAVLEDIKARSKVPIVTGGTGLYLRALLEGLFPGPPRSEELRQRLRKRAAGRGPGYLHRMLVRLDRSAADQIHANDAAKLIRAIEVCLGTSRRMTDLWKAGRAPLQGFRILRIGLNPGRSGLYERINARAHAMFEKGLIGETRRLFEKYADTARPLASLGYKQAMQVVRDEATESVALAAAQQAHRNYAKRQATWFRREPDVHWLNGFGDDPQVLRQAIAVVGRFLEDPRQP